VIRQERSRGRRHWFRAMAAFAVVVWLVPTPAPAAAFGTIEGGGQHRTHEHITRAALACASATGPGEDCFEPRSMDLLAGKDPFFGGVGAPDSDEISNPAAHCDNADFLTADYPLTREQATAGLLECVNHVKTRFEEGLQGADELLDDQGQVVEAEVLLDPADCKVFEQREDRGKCRALDGLGRALHGTQDFYAHSNWADEADPARPVGPDNPLGLNMPGPSPVLDLRTDGPPTVPTALSTGCYVLKDQVPGVGECTGRVTHAAINKDNGLVDPTTGKTTDPTTPRGMVKENFAKAVTGAINETRRQWQDFRTGLVDRYGQEEGTLMVCALTHDDPVNDCAARGWVPILAALLAGGIVIAVAVTMTVHLRRRRRAHVPGHAR
jgi:hypothetical protein